MTTPTWIRTIDDLSAGWLGAALQRPGVSVLDTERIGTGQMSHSHRVRFRAADSPGDAPESVVVKLASDNEHSRAAGVGLSAYYREVAFYQQLAPRIGRGLPACHLAAYDHEEGWFTLVLEEVAGATQGDQIAGCSVEEARLALRELARVHAPLVDDPVVATADFLNVAAPVQQDLLLVLLAGFLDRYADRIAPEHVAVCERFLPVVDTWAADRRPPLGLVHGDYRLDNLLFTEESCTVVDWQTVAWGPVMTDAAYFVGGGLRVEDRRAHEVELVHLYHDELEANGVTGYPFEQCWEDYRRATFHGILMTVGASMLVERTERGDDMFMTWLARNAQQILDLDALALLPDPHVPPTAAHAEPLRPDPADEGRHEPGDEPLWNESWYFDAVSDDGTLGVYVRLGRVPNQGTALYTTAITGPGRASVMVVDDAAPLPPLDDDDQVVRTDAFVASQRCEEPLQRFRIAVEGTGRAHVDHAAPLRAEPGEEVPVRLDLTWHTDGIPFAWRQTTRYEIPCRVTGTVRIGDEELTFAGPGQRDHSWGARDWWAFDWMWSALHLEDGTHTHAVATPAMPGYGVGYVQRGDEIAEIATVHATEFPTDDGLVAHAQIESGPDPLAIDVEPLAWGALRLVAPDGRVSHFPRAMCRVRTEDGRQGTGWVEWNHVQPAGEAGAP